MKGNRFASLSHSKANGDDERLAHDEYETPDEVTRLLMRYVKLTGPVREPACGSGRMTRCLEGYGLTVTPSDIRLGQDFLDNHETWDGHTVTNPPYHKNMADAFVMRSLATTSGVTAMLLQSGFMFGANRTRELYERFPPDMVITVPWRILFYIGSSDRTIKSQAYNHCWFVWNNRRLDRPQTKMVFPQLTAPYADSHITLIGEIK